MSAIDISFVAATAIVNWLNDRWLGPDTVESKRVLAEIKSEESAIEASKARIEKLRTERDLLRRDARARRPTWFRRNREALAVNVVAGLIAGVPFFVLGVLATLLLQK